MAAEHLANRENWQKEARISGDDNEIRWLSWATEYLNKQYPGEYEVKKPEGIRYDKNEKYKFYLDCQITNRSTGITALVENKKQEDKGNAQERACKFYPGTGNCDRVKEEHITGEYAVFLVFSGSMVSKLKYITEIKTTFAKHPKVFLLDDG